MTDPTGIPKGPLGPRVEAALRAARAGGDEALRRYGGSHVDGGGIAAALAVERKRDGSVVTEADRAAELAIVSVLLEAFPDDGVLGEEHDERAGTSGWRWIVDPIDGTKSFVHGVPLWGTLVAAEDASGVQVGVVHLPALDETVWAATNGGAWHRPHRTGAPRGATDDAATALTGARPARVSTEAELSAALVNTTSYDYFAESGDQAVFDRLVRAGGATRGWSDCYAYVLLATGRVDAVVEPILSPWDVACMYPIVREAGGAITDWQGASAGIAERTIATNGALHAAVVRVVGGA